MFKVPPSWSFWDVPGRRDDERLARFYRFGFDLEMVWDIGDYKPHVTDGSEFAGRVERSLEYLLEQQPATVADWMGLTRFRFLTESELYGFLLDVYNYFYGDREEPPVPPDPDRPAPYDETES